VVAGGLYDVQMIFSGSYNTTVHQSGAIRVITENGGHLRRGITSPLKLPHSQYRGAQYSQTSVTANDRLYIECCLH